MRSRSCWSRSSLPSPASRCSTGCGRGGEISGLSRASHAGPMGAHYLEGARTRLDGEEKDMTVGKLAVALVAVVLAVGGLAAISDDGSPPAPVADAIAMSDDDGLARKDDGDDALAQVDDDDDDKKKKKKKGRKARAETDSRSRDGTWSAGSSGGGTTTNSRSKDGTFSAGWSASGTTAGGAAGGAGGGGAGGGAASISSSPPSAGGGTSYSGGGS